MTDIIPFISGLIVLICILKCLDVTLKTVGDT